MKETSILLPIIIPLMSAALVAILPRRVRGIHGSLMLLGSLANLLVCFNLFKQNVSLSLPWAGFGIELSFRLYHFSGFILAAIAAFGFLIAVYTGAFMKGKQNAVPFYAYYLLTLCLANGAVLADNLVVMLFFWEGLLITLFAMIALGKKEAFTTAIKAFTIVGIADLCMMVGIALTAHLAGTFAISKIHLPLVSTAIPAFSLLMIGALAKSGAMPFHSWIPDAAIDAPLPFMALLPAALEKLVGIYFLTRISLDLFQLTPGSGMSLVMMSIGAITIVFAVMMALVQKEYKKLLSYHAISQVGYMVLGIGTALPVGIVGGLFHMINNALYKSCLFLTGGTVEQQAGTADLQKLGGLARKMPVTFFCFFIAAVSISGVPPFNGFFSKELVYDAALERGFIFYLAALIGSFFTAASFLKLGHAAYLGKLDEKYRAVREASWPMLIPMIVIAALCVLFGLYNAIPLDKLIQPILGERAAHHTFAGFPANMTLVILTVIVLLAAVVNHLIGATIRGSGLKAVDHIHHAPLLKETYELAERRFFDPYVIGLKAVQAFSKIAWYLDRGVDWIYENGAAGIADSVGKSLKAVHTGNYVLYLGWAFAGTVLVTMFMMMSR